MISPDEERQVKALIRQLGRALIALVLVGHGTGTEERRVKHARYEIDRFIDKLIDWLKEG